VAKMLESEDLLSGSISLAHYKGLLYALNQIKQCPCAVFYGNLLVRIWIGNCRTISMIFEGAKCVLSIWLEFA
jgi:hypothetical protein